LGSFLLNVFDCLIRYSENLSAPRPAAKSTLPDVLVPEPLAAIATLLNGIVLGSLGVAVL
jgi:hypothetical protein